MLSILQSQFTDNSEHSVVLWLFLFSLDCSFLCYFSKLEHIAHYKAKNPQNTVKIN